MVLNRVFRLIPVEVYGQLRQALSDMSGLFISCLSPARDERIQYVLLVAQDLPPRRAFSPPPSSSSHPGSFPVTRFNNRLFSG